MYKILILFFVRANVYINKLNKYIIYNKIIHIILNVKIKVKQKKIQSFNKNVGIKKVNK